MTHLTISLPIALAALIGATQVTAATLACGIHPPKGIADSALKGIATVTEADARKLALADFPPNSAEISDVELEVERGCLIYSFDIAVRGTDGVEELWVDAGTGQLLARKHETAQHEAAEAASEDAKTPGR